MPGVCPRCLREVYFAEEKLALGKVWHTFCFSCRNCRKLLDSCTVATHCGELFCRNCCTRLFTPSVQSPSPPPTSNLIVEDQGPPFPTGRVPASACDSVSDCYCCCCHPEDYSTCEVRPEARVTPLEKQRLRGGGGEEEESEELRLGRETRRCSESDCSNLGIVSSVTTLCNAPSSPTAVTTWYNRQHSASQSTFGGQNIPTKRRLGRPSSTPSPETVATNFRSNNSDCLNSGSNCSNGRHKCVSSVVRRPGSPCRPLIQKGQNQEQQLKHSPQAQQLQLRLEQQHLQPQLPLQRSQQQQQPQKHNQQHLQQKLNREQIQQQVENLNLNRNKKINCDRTSLRYLRTSKSEKRISAPRVHQSGSGGKITSYETESRFGANINYLRKKLAKPSSPSTTVDHNQFPRRRVSFCSDVPEETNSSTSGISSGRMKMPNENNNFNNHFHGNLSSGSGTTTTSNNPNNYTSSNETSYETCYETDDLNPPEYLTPNSASPSCNCTPDTFEDGEKQTVQGFENEEESRLRGGCGGGGRSGGCGCGSGGCGGSGGCPPVIQPCPPRDECREPINVCGPPRCCSPPGCRPVCKKPTRSCCPPCTAEPQGCGSGGCCGGGCRGGCGKPGRPCMPLRPCSTPPCQQSLQVCRPRGSPCMPPRCCPPIPPCCKPPGVTSRPSCGVGGGGSCCRSKSPRRGCCSSPQDDGGCGYCGPKLPPGCECLGGGLDCQRCGRKVYQAEMQIASGVPYHNICFSCFCCRKPLEPLTYQENCGEIYCKQCYVRNFGPQGYGYGAGAGALQTPL